MTWWPAGTSRPSSCCSCWSSSCLCMSPYHGLDCNYGQNIFSILDCFMLFNCFTNIQFVEVLANYKLVERICGKTVDKRNYRDIILIIPCVDNARFRLLIGWSTTGRFIIPYRFQMCMYTGKRWEVMKLAVGLWTRFIWRKIRYEDYKNIIYLKQSISLHVSIYLNSSLVYLYVICASKEFGSAIWVQRDR